MNKDKSGEQRAEKLRKQIEEITQSELTESESSTDSERRVVPSVKRPLSPRDFISRRMKEIRDAEELE
ncbi:MAG: hypothetical protein JNM43_29495 [Planctomycetaceae bacterium]|nr:hypothetical protein [Planctomycetaceae bacterium]